MRKRTSEKGLVEVVRIRDKSELTVVLANGRGGRDIVLDYLPTTRIMISTNLLHANRRVGRKKKQRLTLVEARDTSIVQVQNSTTSLYKVSNLLGAGRASVPEELFIL